MDRTFAVRAVLVDDGNICLDLDQDSFENLIQFEPVISIQA
jgi:hypothetical protein